LREKRVQELLSAKERKSEIPKYLIKYFNKSGKINSHAIKRQDLWEGLSLIFITGKMTISEAIDYYFGKDLIEKSFMSLKSILGLRPIRHWLDGKIKGHVFICYLSLVLLTTFRCQLAKNGSGRVKSISQERALKELESVCVIEYSKHKSTESASDIQETLCQKVVTLTSLQRDILSAIVPKFKNLVGKTGVSLRWLPPVNVNDADIEHVVFQQPNQLVPF
jgi:transposase